MYDVKLQLRLVQEGHQNHPTSYNSIGTQVRRTLPENTSWCHYSFYGSNSSGRSRFRTIPFTKPYNPVLADTSCIVALLSRGNPQLFTPLRRLVFTLIFFLMSLTFFAPATTRLSFPAPRSPLPGRPNRTNWNRGATSTPWLLWLSF